MAALSEMIFLLSFIICASMFFVKLYNVFSIGKWYDRRFTWLGLAGFFLSYSLVIGTYLLNATDITYFVIFRVATFLIIPTVIIHIIEMWFQYDPMKSENVEAYMSNKDDRIRT